MSRRGKWSEELLNPDLGHLAFFETEDHRVVHLIISGILNTEAFVCPTPVVGGIGIAEHRTVSIRLPSRKLPHVFLGDFYAINIAQRCFKHDAQASGNPPPSWRLPAQAVNKISPRRRRRRCAKSRNCYVHSFGALNLRETILPCQESLAFLFGLLSFFPLDPFDHFCIKVSPLLLRFRQFMGNHKTFVQFLLLRGFLPKTTSRHPSSP